MQQINGARHKRAFEKWKSTLPNRTKLVVDAVVQNLVPEIERHGFEWVNSLLPENDKEVDRADVIPLMRSGTNFVDLIQIDFSKKGKPTFGVAFRRWLREELDQKQMWLPHFLTTRNSAKAQYKKFGFSTLDPFVSAERSSRLVNSVIGLLPQLFDCLDSHKLGPNVTPAERIHNTPT